MKNPCNECLVKVNCTEVCPDKENFQVWLKRGIEYYQHGRLATTPHLKKLFVTLLNMETENSSDIIRITLRSSRLKSENNFEF
jgi:hypothetical protein